MLYIKKIIENSYKKIKIYTMFHIRSYIFFKKFFLYKIEFYSSLI